MSLKLNQYALLTLTLTLLLNSTNLLWGQTSASQSVTSSGKEFMVPKKEVNGKLIGQEDVLIQEVVVTDSDRRYFRLDAGVSGTVAGWVVKEGSAFHRRHFRSAPEFTFTQIGNVHRLFHGIVRYEASKGIGMTLIYPEAGTGWRERVCAVVVTDLVTMEHHPLGEIQGLRSVVIAPDGKSVLVAAMEGRRHVVRELSMDGDFKRKLLSSHRTLTPWWLPSGDIIIWARKPGGQPSNLRIAWGLTL